MENDQINQKGLFSLTSPEVILFNKEKYLMRIFKAQYIVYIIHVHVQRTCFIFQLRIGAYDTGNPEEVVYTEMIISVNRNEFGPVFEPSEYTSRMTENTPLGSEVTKLVATDNDEVFVIFFFWLQYIAFICGYDKTNIWPS